MSWSITQARQHFGRIVARAEVEGLQVVTEHGIPIAVIITPDQWRRLTKRFDALAQAEADAQTALLRSPSQGQA
jgi:prevent-host-death family protein